MRWAAGFLLLLAALGWAQDKPEKEQDKSVGPLLDRTLRPLLAYRERRPPPGDPSYKEWAEEYEYLRKKAVKKVLATIRFHGPGGEGKPLDIAPACEALLSPLLAPPKDEDAWRVAEELLRLDPNSSACWVYMEALYERVRITSKRRKDQWGKLHAWLKQLRGAQGIDGEAALAVEMLAAHVSFEMGDKRSARKAAQVVLTGDAGSATLREAARRLHSRASLLAEGRNAPGFRIASRDGGGELSLEDFRGRCVLLHFWHIETDAGRFHSILLDSRQDVAESDLVILTVPLFDGAAPPEGWKQRAEGFGWPVAAANHVAQDAARAYGVDGISALFLVSPDGRILKGGRWTTGGASQRVREMIRSSAGPPLLLRLRQANSWTGCRTLWHDLAARGHVRFANGTWSTARKLGPYAHAALLLASAGAKGETPRKVETDTVHGRLIDGWRRLRVSNDASPWTIWTGPLSRPNSDECLETVDAIYDLGLIGDAVRQPLEKIATRSARWETVSMALRAIHFSDTETSPQPLRKQLRHKTWQVRLALAEALRAYRHKHAVDILIQLLGDKRMRVRAKAVDHLELLTGASNGHSQKRWAKWRRKQGADLRLRPREISVYRPFRPHDRKYAHRDYYGLQVASDRVVFVLDKSESMYYGLFDGVVEEVRAHLESAGPTTRFNVIEFDEAPRQWNKKLVPSNQTNLGAMVRFLNRAEPYGPTNIIDSLRLGMKTPELDAIVLLSDGLPNRGTPSRPDRILAVVAKENRYTRFAIHTVLLLGGRRFPYNAPRGDKVPPIDAKERARREAVREWAPTSELGSFLKSLAERNDGTFGVGFADSWAPPPGTRFRPSTDK